MSTKQVVRANHQDQNNAAGCKDLINTNSSTMPFNCTSNDTDPVPPTQYNVQPNRVSKKPPPEPWSLPDFEPLHISCIFLRTATVMH